MVTSHDQQPVQTLGADRTNPALRKGVRHRRLHRCQDDPGALGAEQLIEAAAELGVPVAQEEAQASSPLAQCQQEVASLLGDPGAIRIGGHASQVDAAAVQLDEDQHIQTLQPDGVDGEESGRGESHPPALAEPCVNLSTHTAPITQSYGHAPSRQCANRVGSRLAMSARNLLARLR